MSTQAWEAPRRFLLVFLPRSGSTFLAHCLDSHPDIGAERGEPLNPEHVWKRTLGEAGDAEILGTVLSRPGYRATVARANYRHAMEVPGDVLRTLDGLIFLYREDLVRNLISSHMNVAGRKAIHAYEAQPAARIRIDPEDFVRGCRRASAKREETLTWLQGLGRPLYVTTYAAIAGGEGHDARGVPEAEARRLCEFLGVPVAPLACDLRRINPEPPEQLVKNWAEVEAALKESECGECLSSV